MNLKVSSCYSQWIDYSNICTNLCKFCAFGKEKGDESAYEMTIEEIKNKVRQRLDEPITEIHMVGGIHPDLPYSYYLEALRGIKEVRPDVHIQAFTCVEIQHLADLSVRRRYPGGTERSGAGVAARRRGRGVQSPYPRNHLPG